MTATGVAAAGAPTLDRRRIVADRSLVGAVFCRAYSRRVDEWLARSYVASGGPERGVCLLAVGGYGRCELSPESDLDLLLLHEPERDVTELAGALWYPVWNEGLKLGHAVRTLRETLQLASADLDTATSLLSARHVAGDRGLAARLAGGARDQWSRQARRWLPQLTADARWRGLEHGEVAFRLQPDLKESTGGLRDLQALRYVALARPDLADPAGAPAEDAQETLLAARVELHRATGNARNLLTLEVQADVAAALGHRCVEDFMTAVAVAGRTVGWVADETWARIEHWSAPAGRTAHRAAVTTLEPGVQIRHDRNELRLLPELQPGGDPLLPLRAAAAAARHGARIERESLVRLGAEMVPLSDPWPPGARELLVDLLACGHNAIPVIEALDQVGAVVKILPEWERCRSRLQRNDYHRFTVDRHLCETAAQAADMIAGGEVSVPRPDLLLVAALLHDIGKGYPGDHTEVGMVLMAQIGRRMGFDEDETAMLVRLVELHLLLPDVAIRRDIDEIGTVRRVAEQVVSVETLRLLAALTEADAIATGPSVWTRWKADLVRGLVSRTENYLHSGVLDGSPDSFPTPEVSEAMAAGRELLEVSDRRLVVVVPSAPTVLGAVAGAISLNGLNVLAAAVHSAGGMTALAVFVEPAPGAAGLEWAPVLADVRAALAGELVPGERLARWAHAASGAGGVLAPEPVTESYVRFDNEISAVTVIEVAAPDSLGLLHRITEALLRSGLHISQARVQTLGDHVVDSFYVYDAADGKITDPRRLREIAEAVREASGLAPSP
ncbi:MAG: [protein-PII] uridylyltransferase [bacterium]|nr:[protein-PII] uridylyltransferase [bacterium]MDE0668571.1 [protein-PII] uridylyltransferase [bacterium]MXZ31252.1 [protein-PII] uridylyltransferase [Acidimicrobiia bacterium]MYB25050.1 [protein-PII] uridylyltransferase [Acidimicrobiia bacterium]MYJ14269.1 [protein-PII] uridylyltransferase [Acidimicrobiia bacterium]